MRIICRPKFNNYYLWHLYTHEILHDDMYINERIMNVQVSNYGSSSPRVAAATTNCNHSIRRVHTHSAHLLVFVRTEISGSV